MTHAVIGVGGLLGVGEEKMVVPYSALRMSGHQNGRRSTIAIDQATLDKAPKYVKATDRAPAASPATSTRPGTTSGSSGLSGDPRPETKRDTTATDKPAEKKY